MKHCGMMIAAMAAGMTLFAVETAAPRVVVKQGFENPEFFAKVNKNHYTTGPAVPQGKWFAVSREMIVKDQALEGEYSLRIRKSAKKGEPIPALHFNGKQGEHGLFSCWLYRQKNHNICLQFRGVDAKGKNVSVTTIGAWDKNRQWAYWDNDKVLPNGKKGGYVRSGRKFPAEEWIKVTMDLNPAAGTYTVSVGDADSSAVLAKGRYAGDVRLYTLWFSSLQDAEIGSATYVDNIEYSVIR